MRVLRILYQGDRKFVGKYGPYDAFRPKDGWCPPRYLAIDQGPIPVMIENHRTGMVWKLFMSCPEISAGLDKLEFENAGQ